MRAAPVIPVPSDDANISRHLGLLAARQPSVAALKVPRGRTGGGDIDYLALSFSDLAAEVGLWRAHLAGRGIRRGDRVLVMVRQGLPLIASAFALFQLGAVPILIDPGMGLGSFLKCVARSRPRAMLGIPLARLVSRVFRSAFASVEIRVAVSGALTARLAGRVGGPGGLAGEPAIVGPGDLAAVLFTSGSTGAPKGVCYTHGMFEAQVRLVRDTYGIFPGEIDLPLLPIFALFNPALGMTTVVPEMDPRHPAAADPARLVQAIRQENVTNSFGSPTLWRNVADYCRARKITLPSLHRVLCAGAPVPPTLWADLDPVLPNGSVHSPYGATEALPVSTIGAVEALAEGPATLQGAGTCVGRPIVGNQVRIISLADRPLAGLAETAAPPPGEIGEIIVTGPSVTREYDALPAATTAAKIPDGQRIWHRMGDAGWIDAAGRLWFCGRIAERVETAAGPLYTGQVEPWFNTHPAVRRTALIAVDPPAGAPVAALVVELVAPAAFKGTAARRRLAHDLVLFARGHPFASRIRIFYFHPRFPVDTRHNAKIHRLTLACWAVGAKGFHSDPKR